MLERCSCPVLSLRVENELVYQLFVSSNVLYMRAVDVLLRRGCVWLPFILYPKPWHDSRYFPPSPDSEILQPQ